MWAVDDDGSCWVGGLVIDQHHQGRGLGRAVTQTLVDWFRQQDGHWASRLSYHPDNPVAAGLYASVGFVPTGEIDDDGEVVVELRKG
jgi:diamine N-acetyltransferase